jgi:DNA topoisomerase III
MGKSLIITEKPSVATDITKALGGFSRDKSGDFLESEKWVVSWAVGHLLELAVPQQFEVLKGKWSLERLPHMPPHFDLAPIEKAENRLKAIARLLKRKDVTEVVNACDAGREGELIFRNIIAYTGAKQPIRRLWLQSMTPTAIRDGFAKLRSDQELRPLADASRCRSEADWLVGINATRAMTAFNSRAGGFYLTTVGRVQTPTLAIVVDREEKIKRFVSRDYWEVSASFGAASGVYEGRWFDEKFRRADGKDADPDLKPERLWDKARAEVIRDKCLGKPGVVTEETKPASQLSPLLYDLTTLQREANSRFGFSAKTTLAIAQALYERHKMLTYPRTDSRHLPEDYVGSAKDAASALGRDAAGPYAPFTSKILANGWIRPNKRVFNNAKVSDHFAIIPTGQSGTGLSEAERKLYDMVVRRFLAVFYPAAEFLETVRITRVEGEPFKSVGKVMVQAGWMEVYGREAMTEDASPTLAPVGAAERPPAVEVVVKALQTKPPAHYTEATLLSAMEGAGKLVEDDELRDAMAERGLGTPATRAAIIEGLISENYLLRQGREIWATAKAVSLMQLLRGLGVNELTKPEMTGEWEFELKNMEHGRLGREQFMGEIRAFTEKIVAKAKQYGHDTIPGDFGVLKTPCPRCGDEVHEQYREFKCRKCGFFVRKVLSGRMWEPSEVETLIREGRSPVLQGFRSKIGRPFAASIRLTPEFEARFDFGEEGGAGENGGEGAAPPDFSDREPVAKCPKCGARVFEHGSAYVCEKSVLHPKGCDFRSGAMILQQPIDRTQFVKLVTEGKTDLLNGFVSKKNNRKFEARLVLKDGAIGFEFPPREEKGKGGKAGKDGAPAA